jgi:hypothetical protein
MELQRPTAEQEDENQQVEAPIPGAQAEHAKESTGEVLTSLRRGWLATVETPPEVHAPPQRRQLTIRVRRGFGSLAGGVGFWFEQVKRRVSRPAFAEVAEAATAAEEVRAREEPAPQKAPNHAPVIPSVPCGPVAPPLQEPALLDIRDGWLAEAQGVPEKHARKIVTGRMKLRREFEPITDELAYGFECVKEFVLRAVTFGTNRRRRLSGERARRAEAGARFFSAAFVIAAALGTVLYVATALHVFDTLHLSQALGR